MHEFAKNVYNVRANDGAGHSLEIAKVSPSRWNVTGHHGTVVVEYTLFGDRADGTYDGIDSTHAHLNMPATIMWAHGFEKSPYSLKFVVPEGSNWKPATQLDPVRVVNDAVQDGVREGGITDQVMPSFDRDLAGDQCGTTTITLFDDLQQIASLLRAERFKAPVIQNEQPHPAERPHQACEASVATGQTMADQLVAITVGEQV